MFKSQCLLLFNLSRDNLLRLSLKHRYLPVVIPDQIQRNRGSLLAFMVPSISSGISMFTTVIAINALGDALEKPLGIREELLVLSWVF